MKRTVLAVIAAFVLIIANGVAANAQARHKAILKRDVPFEFVVANRVFPAGTYTFEIATGTPSATDQTAVLVVRGAERKFYAAVATGIVSGVAVPAGHKLVFVRSGDRVFLSKVWQQGNAAGLSVPKVGNSPRAEAVQESEVLTLDAVPQPTGGV